MVICLANRRVSRAAETAPADHDGGMGTTIVGVILSERRPRSGRWGQPRLLALGRPALAGNHRRFLGVHDPRPGPVREAGRHGRASDANVLTNVLGGRSSVEVRVSEHTLRDGDALLLCSDGLHGVGQYRALQGVLEKTPDVQAAAKTSLKPRSNRSSRDNVTALVVRYEADR